MRIIERLPRTHFCVKLIPIVEPGDFSISINKGPVACLTLSKREEYICLILISYRSISPKFNQNETKEKRKKRKKVTSSYQQ